VKLSALLSANGLQRTSLIQEGDELTIPSGSSASGAASGTSSGASSKYTVKEGDVLERIARRHGVKLSSLLSANDLERTSLIMAGDRLVIPAGGSSSSNDSSSSSGSSGDSSSSAGSVGPDLVCPVPGASYMNDWGFPRGSARFHEGTDLFASTGTTIVAPASGVVSFGSNGLGGTTFTLSTNSGWVIYGAHLDSTIGSSGSVSAGTPIGTVGDSGNAAGGDPHLHLGIKPAGGQAINPYPSLRAACG
jgi:murein DD-endopeptidase MepM/ murein hydrolase activator NlpD